MEIVREKVHDSRHPMAQDDADWGENEAVVVKLTHRKQYNDIVSVEIQSEEETNKYEFEVLPDEVRRLTYPDGESVPLGIRLYLSDFGYYLEHSADGPWGQYEYLIDASGRFEARAEQTNSPVSNYLFRQLSFRFQEVVIEIASETAVANEEFTHDQLAEATDIPDSDGVQLVHAITELKKMPLSEDTVIPERFESLDLGTEIVMDSTTDPSDENVNISTVYNGKQDTTAVIVSLPYDAKYFKLNGAPGRQCSLEFTNRGELPGLFIEDHLYENADIQITNTPRINPSASHIELLSQARTLLKDIQATDGINTPSEESTVEITEMMVDTAEVFLRIQQAVGTDQFLNLADTVFAERTDGLTVKNLTDAPLNQYTTVVALLGLAIQRLGKTEKEQIEIEIERKGLDENDTESVVVDDLPDFINEQIATIDENW